MRRGDYLCGCSCGGGGDGSRGRASGARFRGTLFAVLCFFSFVRSIEIFARVRYLIWVIEMDDTHVLRRRWSHMI